MRETTVVGWDIGGAHVKASLLRGGEVVDAAQWPCPLWQGLQHLHHALAAAQQLNDAGVLAVAIRPPTVPEGTSRLRFALNSTLAEPEMERLLAALSDL